MNQVTSKNITRRESVTYPGLFVRKYTRNVFFKNLWNDELIECRGHVEDEAGNIVVRPFTKIFNRFENKTDIPDRTQVVAVRKVNGFMGCVTWVPSRNACIVSTTGSLDSPFVMMAQAHLSEKVFDVVASFKDRPATFMFEIVHKDDPHVVPEVDGAYLLGARYVDDESGYNSNVGKEHELDTIADMMGVMRPAWKQCTFAEVVEDARNCQHEGYVVYSKDVVLKIKSPFYLTTKFLGRLGKNKLQSMAEDPLSFKKQLDEEFHPVLETINACKAQFLEWDEQNRMAFIRGCLKGLQT